MHAGPGLPTPEVLPGDVGIRDIVRRHDPCMHAQVGSHLKYRRVTAPAASAILCAVARKVSW